MNSIEETLTLPIEKAGFVAIVGRPNAGKSTLLNAILGQKLAIVAPRPQTTRQRLLGVCRWKSCQFAFVDTPGLHSGKGPHRSLLNEFMVEETKQVLLDCDVVLFVLDAKEAMSAKDRVAFLFQALPANKPVILALNKVDLVSSKLALLPLIDVCRQAFPFCSIMPISAQKEEGLQALLADLGDQIPNSGPLFPEETWTDRSERYLAEERIREQVFVATREEVPHGVAVNIDAWEERTFEKGPRAGTRKQVRIDATIHVEKESHKRIVVGKGGRQIQDIGTKARQEIAALLDCPVQLFLFVRVDENWTGRSHLLKEWGYA